MPRRMRDHSTPSSSLSREQFLPRKEPSGRSGAQAAHPPPTMVWGAHGRPFPRQRPRKRVDLKRPSRPAAKAPPSRSWPSSRDEESCVTTTRRDQTAKAYEARNLPSPLSLRAHSTRGVVSSQALFRGVPLEDICVAAGWSSPHTFVRFYNLDIDMAPGSQVLSVWTSHTLLVRYWTRWGSVFSLACLVYRSKAWKAHAV